MKFGYAYKTSDGTRHESTFEAKSKEEVFSTLRAQGTKPIKVWEIHSRFYISRRTCIIILLAVALAGSLIYAHILHSSLKIVTQAEATTTPRHQIYGDPVILEDMERDNYASIFPEVGDRVLAAYAIPGRPTVNLPRISSLEMCKALTDCKSKDITVQPSDVPEVAELKRIVQGMKDEMRWYVSDGEGTVETYLQRLRERQSEEIKIYERTLKELETETDPKIRMERNAALRAMGLRTIPRPKKSDRE